MTDLPYVSSKDWPKDRNTPVYGHVIGEPSDIGWMRCHRCRQSFDDWGPNTECEGPLPVACHEPGCRVHKAPAVYTEPEDDWEQLASDFSD